MEKYLDKSLSPEERAKDLTDRMTVEEQASQLKYDAPPIERLGIPAYNWWNEGLHGVARAGTATMFPQAIAMAAAFDCGLVKRMAEITATEARAKYNAAAGHGDRDIYKGLTLWSPNINIFRDPRWGRGQETYGEDPFLTSRLGVSYVKGLQGDGEVMKAAACAKHFAVHSGPEAGRHEFDAVASKKDMEETYLFAFEALVREAKAEGVMGAYNRVNGEPSCASAFLMEKLDEWGFDGYFVSDCWAIKDFHENHGVTKTAPESAALALKLGCHLNCGSTYLHILEALREGLITEEDIRSACVRLMTTRIRLGMLDGCTEYDNIPYSVISCPEHKAVSLEAAEKSMVLLKNNGILPIDKDSVRTIAVIGPNADSREALTGNYCGTADRYVTFLEGIEDEFDGRVIYAEGCHLWRDRISGLALPDDRYAEALAAAENADLVVLVLGLDASIEGEEGDAGNEFSSGDKKDLLLPEPQRALVSRIAALNKPTVAVVAAGSAINAGEFDALIHAWYPGQYGGRALANILFGKVSPSGKLPVTFYETADKLPGFTDYSMENRTYRYARDNVLYPFGYGLTYSRVVCKDIEYKENIAVVTAENIGGVDTDEVIELYIKDYSPFGVPNFSLCGFKRVSLKAGESVTVNIAVPRSAFESVDNDGVRAIRGDRYTLYAGVCAPDAISEELTGSKAVSIDIVP